MAPGRTITATERERTVRTRELPELWGGVECTVNRIGDLYHDQLERTGHASRHADLELFAELGISSIRYPVLWERTAPCADGECDWSWPDERLGHLRELGIRPIVGLLHHGSGPHHTGLLDPLFPEQLARYARAVVERYPWVEDYTPINEPLTTARFSALYGLWYPHERDDRAFARAIINQCRGVRLAMEAIREVRPSARLIQTEDLGRTFSTPELAYQADFENERRWLTYDLLAGRVDRHHPMWSYLLWGGIDEAELEWFLDAPLPPDLIGINHYVTSERFLDERLERYPPHTHGGNHRHRYADVEAVRVRTEGMMGPEAMMREVWERYRIPVAVTEAHIGCSREGQIRWLAEIWRSACALRNEGANIVAVTAWSLLGSYDWHTLLTREEGVYEPGVFDLRAPRPRLTAVGKMVRDLARTGRHDHPILDGPGWWRRNDRFIYPPISCFGDGAPAVVTPCRAPARPLLIAGAGGTLGRAFMHGCAIRGIACIPLTRSAMDIAARESVRDAMERYGPWGVINAAGYLRVDEAEQEIERCRQENLDGPAILAEECARRNISFLTFSSDLVFDGSKSEPYVESDQPSPLNIYGWSRMVAEHRVRQSHPDAMIVRTSALFGSHDERTAASRALRRLASGEMVDVADDLILSPAYLPDLVAAALDLLIDRERGIWHLANSGAICWADFIHMIAERAGADTSLLNRRSVSSLGLVARRPLFTPLKSERADLMPSLESAVERYVERNQIGKMDEIRC